MPGRHTLAVILGLLLAAAVAAGVPGSAFADPRDISVGGVYITTIEADWQAVTSYQRAIDVTRRITEVLSSPAIRHGAVIAIRPYGADAVITVGGLLVFTVTPADVTGSYMTPVQVAHQWAQKLAEGLSKALPSSTFHF